MKLTDIELLAKKILVGVVIAAVPLAILSGGLWITQSTLKNNPKTTAKHFVEAPRAN